MIRASVLLALAGAAWGQSAATQNADQEIRAARQASNQAIVRGDVRGFLVSLADDYRAIRGNGTEIVSVAAYREAMERTFADRQAVRFQRVTDRVTVAQTGGFAAEHGTWIGHDPSGQKAFGGTYLAMWRHTPNGWKIRSELFVFLDCHQPERCRAYLGR
ncbi:MAG: nuclear transport factor 2 family protein [Acidobacteria bacterium]|nr:nuclear transport factor 2 family protein [Acidobacteriota bacterium]